MISYQTRTGLLAISFSLLLIASCDQSNTNSKQPQSLETAPTQASEQTVNPEAEAPATKESEPKVAVDQQTNSITNNLASKQLTPGDYCFTHNSQTLEAQITFNLQDDNQVTGVSSATISNPEAGYYTSYTQDFTGSLEDEKLSVNVTTQIENDTQQTQETWTMTSNSLMTKGQNYQRVPCPN